MCNELNSALGMNLSAPDCISIAFNGALPARCLQSPNWDMPGDIYGTFAKEKFLSVLRLAHVVTMKMCRGQKSLLCDSIDLNCGCHRWFFLGPAIHHKSCIEELFYFLFFTKIG